MPASYCLEIAAFTLRGALEAAHAGAHRIELCDNASEGGTTPSYGMLLQAKKNIRIPVFPIIRPRGGNFVYSGEEIECMKNDLQICKDLQFPGVVLGVLHPDGSVNQEITAALVECAFPMEVTFHRAFDRTANPHQALEDIIACGCKRVLSSGQYPTLTEGLILLTTLMQQANNRIIIMPGSGLNSSNINEIALKTGAKEFHTAARKKISDESIFAPITMNEKLEYTTVDSDEIRKILLQLDACLV